MYLMGKIFLQLGRISGGFFVVAGLWEGASGSSFRFRWHITSSLVRVGASGIRRHLGQWNRNDYSAKLGQLNEKT